MTEEQRTMKVKKWAAHCDTDVRFFDTEDEAAEVYNRAALEAWGEMARLNITGGDAS